MRLPTQFPAWLGLVLVLALGWAVYFPGLSGGFLFDDFINLDALGKNGAITGWDALARYLTSGLADPLGRPVSLLSFLLDARDWPADPRPFLRTNLLLHLANGALLYFLLRGLGQALGDPSRRRDLTALLGAALWLLHPLFVSTTLYAVQREAMLPATFTLLGLLAYAKGREVAWTAPRTQGLVLMAAGIVGGTALAALSKANGLLLPALAGVLELAIFVPADRRIGRSAGPWLRHAQCWLIVLPCLLLLGYLLLQMPHWNEPIPSRGWSVGQRVLTESRILWSYVERLAVPTAYSSGLYNDHVLPSTGLLHPWTTLPSVLGIVATLLAAIRWRAFGPSASAAVLFFLVGHVLESSVVRLELYFEHRNYLPAMLVFWPLSRGLCAGGHGRLRVLAAIALVALLALTTLHRARLWGDPSALAATWARENPGSPRAQVTAAADLLAAHRPIAARELLRAALRSAPGDLQLELAFADAACRASSLDDAAIASVERTLRETPIPNELIFRWLGDMVARAATGQCKGLRLDDVHSWAQSAGTNPALRNDAKGQAELAAVQGRIALARRDPDAALRAFNASLALDARPETALRQAAWLASDGYFAQGLRHLDRFEAAGPAPRAAPGMPRLHDWVLRRQGYWDKEFSWMRSQLKAHASPSGRPGQ